MKEEIRHLKEAVHRISGTDSGNADGRRVILTGDLNVTLPEEAEGITGRFVFSNKPKRSVTFAHRLRRQSMIELLGCLGLWAANTFSAVEGTPRVRAATWRINTAEGPQPHSQLDYACVPGGWEARAEVLDSPIWDWSDHRPLRLSARTDTAWVTYTKPPWTCTGWTPKAAADEDLFRRMARDSLLAGRRVKSAGGARSVAFSSSHGFLRESQQATMEAALAVDFMTPALATWMEKQASPEEVEAKRLMRCWLPQEEHQAARRVHCRLKRKRRAAKRRAALTRLGKARCYRPMPTVLMLDGKPETDIDKWQTSLREWMINRYSLTEQEAAERRMIALEDIDRMARGSAQARRTDGHPPPLLSLWDAMQLWASAAKGTAGGRDGITQEMYLMWPVGIKILLWKTFRRMLLMQEDRRGAAPASWDLLDLAGLPKAELLGGWEDFRWIAKAAVMAKHWHRYLIAAAMSLPRDYPVQSYGFSRGFRTADVYLAISWAAALAKRFPYELVVLEADIRWCFDEMDHCKMFEALQARQWPPEVISALIGEYRNLNADAKVLGTATTGVFPFRRAGRTGGTETPQILVEMVQAACGPLVEYWQREGLGFKVATDAPGGRQLVANLLNWADNMWILAAGLEEARVMFAQLTEVLYQRLAMRWKMSALKVLVVRAEGLLHLCPDGETLHIAVPRVSAEPFALKKVEFLDVLGCRVDADADPFVMMEHRGVAANLLMHGSLNLLRSKEVPVTNRLRALATTAEAAFLYSCDAWMLSGKLLEAAKADNFNRMRTVARLWKRPDFETRARHLKRTAEQLRKWCDAGKVALSHVQILRRVHRAAGRAAVLCWNGQPAPVQVLLRHRNRWWTGTFKTACLQSCRRKETVGHLLEATSGRRRAWEDPFVAWRGPEWLDSWTSATAWKESEESFVAKIGAAWGLKVSAADGAKREGGPQASSLAKDWREEWRTAGGPTRMRELRDSAWTGAWCWEIFTDSLMVANLVNGEWAARPEKSVLGDQCRAAVNILLRLWEKGWAPGEQEAGWVTWVPREENAAADALANLALDLGRAWRWTAGLASLWGGKTKEEGTLRAWVDGGRRSSRAASAALLVWWPSGGTAPFLLAAEVEVWESEQGDGQLPTVPWLEAHAVLLAARLLQLVPGSQAEGYELAEMDYGREEEEEWVVEVLSWLSRPVAAGAGGRRRGAAASAAG